MIWRNRILKFKWKMGKDKWLILLAVGMIILILTFPSGSGMAARVEKTAESKNQTALQKGIVTEPADGEAAVAAGADRTYEEQLEARVKRILKTVDGVGQVEVMIVLKSSEEKVLRVDKDSSDSSTEEKDSSGGTRKITSADRKENTILTGSGENTSPIVEKEIRPEIEGIIISAQGGGSPTVKAEISGAMEALFNLPPHKIKVLKRVE
ncbi:MULTISPECIES: stage III sporulation protein AG [Lacrimispora]|jgi:stage III sporulation protein AG|uniref:Stage III sporulation protein AG n=1 Tax=Lacrimispora celerecrescens TaxID=29354 RepID=A0A084JRZ5_9FIRM|nr:MULTISPECIES: stage III sporulation protein AG [Clostridia]KEZ91729.1 stage III sporulation protein AG [Lacrimispora celerecrescens]MBW4848366.1 stage III sporulation protein AG [Lachnospiraceae bacterium]MSS09080.1 stage III sporulation protein AG [Clostridium sp. WB02_MRS01]